MDRAKGRDLMRRHTIPGALYTEGLLQRRTIRTLAGTSVTFRRDMDGRAPARDVALGRCLDSQFVDMPRKVSRYESI